MKWAHLATYISMGSVIIPFIIGVYRFKYLNALQKLIGLSVVVTLLGEFGIYLLTILDINNLFAVHLYTVLQFAVLVLIMEKGLFPLLSRIVSRSLIFLFALFALMDAFWWNDLYSFNTYARPLSSFILLLLVLLFFYKTLKELKIKSLERAPLFWLSIGLILYFSGSLFIFLFTNYVKTSNEALLTIWGIHAIFNIIFNISYSIALWIKPVN